MLKNISDNKLMHKNLPRGTLIGILKFLECGKSGDAQAIRPSLKQYDFKGKPMVKKLGIFYFILFFPLLFQSCTNDYNYIEKMVPPKYDIFARKNINYFIHNKFDSIYYSIAPSVRNSKSISLFKNLRLLIPDSEVQQIKIVNFNTFFKKIIYSPNNNSQKKINKILLQYEIKVNKKFFLITFILNKAKELQISGFYIKPLPKSVEELSKFSFSNATIVNYIFILLAIIVLFIIFYSLFLIVKTKIKRKWLWFLFSLFGFIKIGSVWGTFDIRIYPFTFQFLGVSFLKTDLFTPYVLSFSIPIGAIIFLLKRKKLFSKSNQS